MTQEPLLIQDPENHTLFSGTYLPHPSRPRPNQGVPAPPPPPAEGWESWLVGYRSKDFFLPDLFWYKIFLEMRIPDEFKVSSTAKS